MRWCWKCLGTFRMVSVIDNRQTTTLQGRKAINGIGGAGSQFQMLTLTYVSPPFICVAAIQVQCANG